MSEIGLMPPGRLGHVDETSCFVCGCTDQVACPGGCWWAADDEDHLQDVCSRCVELRDDLLEAGRPVTLEQLLGGAPKMAHRHGVDEQGREWILNLPDVPDAEWLEREGEYLGRGTGMYAASHLFDLGGGELGAIADMDVLSIEELP